MRESGAGDPACVSLFRRLAGTSGESPEDTWQASRLPHFMKTTLHALRILLVFTLLTGVIYPLAVTGISKVLFAKKANGSLVVSDGKIFGSELLAQKFDSPQYFWSRPSAADCATIASGASNKGPTSADLASQPVSSRWPPLHGRRSLPMRKAPPVRTQPGTAAARWMRSTWGWRRYSVRRSFAHSISRRLFAAQTPL